MISKKIQKEIEIFQEIIFICECIMRDTDNQADYEAAEQQLFQTEVQLQELENKFSNNTKVSQ